MRRFIIYSFFLFLMACPFALAEPFIAIEEMTTPAGVSAWFVRDETVPVIAIQFAFNAGSAYDPADKSGLAHLASTLMDEGAGDDDASTFQKKLKDHAIQFSFSAGRDGFYGQIKTIKEHKDTAFQLLKTALNQPRFDEDAIERMRAGVLTNMRYDRQDASWYGQKSLFEHVYSDHPYARQIKGTMETVTQITQNDLRKFHRTMLTQDQLIIGIVGDLTKNEAVLALDHIFGSLPKTAPRPTVYPATLKLNGGTLYTPWNGPQSVIMMAQKGVARRDENWFTAQLLNYILGGGGFSSRLMQELRVERGLTYGISTGIIDYQYGPLLLGQASVDRDKTQEATQAIRDQWQRMAQHGVTSQELADAKAYLVGSMPLALTSTDAIAQLLIQMQENDLPIDYLDQRADEINSISLEKINNFAKTWIHRDNMTIVITGPQPKE